MGNILDDWFGIEPPKAPKIPDPMNTAQTQQGFNTQQAAQQAQYNRDAMLANISANRLDQTTPFSSINYYQTGTDQYGNATYGVNTDYSPEQRALLEQLQQSQQQFGGIGQDLISGLSEDPRFSGLPDFTDMANPLMQRHLAIMNPYYEQQFNKLDTDLRNQGLTPGTPAYDNAIRAFRQTQSESVGQFANQSIQSVMAQYQQPFDMIRAIMGATGPVNMPNLGQQTPPGVNLNAPNVGNVNFHGITSDVLNAQMKQYENEYKAYADSINAIGTIGGTILGAPTGTFFGNAVGGLGSGLASMLGVPSTGASGGVLPLFRSTPPVSRPA
jgi:hypothetical protein